MAKIYIIAGNTGAGKSTYSRALSKETNCFRFTVDEWMKNLFTKDQPNPIEYQWALERTTRIEAQILESLTQYKALDLGAILDLGFFQKSHRERVKNKIIALGLEPELHYLDCSAKTRWERIEKRNKEQGETFSQPVDKKIFEFCEGLFEVPDQEELTGAKVIKE